MARKAKVRYYPSRGGYYCWHRGKQHRLATGPKDEPDGPTFSEAVRAFAMLVCPVTKGKTVAELVELHCDWIAAHRQANTAAVRRSRLRQLVPLLGERCAETLTAYEAETACQRLRQERNWTRSTLRLMLTCLKACISWGVKKGVITSASISQLEMPPMASRGIECVLTEEQVQNVLDVAHRHVRSFIAFLRDTGCRPGEAVRLEARQYRPDLRAFVIPARGQDGDHSHKTARYGKDRVIYVRGESVAEVERLCGTYRRGPIFRNSKVCRQGPLAGQRGIWKQRAIDRLFRRIREKAGIPKLIAYSFRHTFAVRWLRAGKPIAALAEVLGTSIQMIQKHYGHLAEQKDYLRRLVDEPD